MNDLYSFLALLGLERFCQNEDSLQMTNGESLASAYRESLLLSVCGRRIQHRSGKLRAQFRNGTR
jgi:hypothetical protein